MKKIVFTEEYCTPANLFPFSLTRQVQDIRMGILTLREKWEHYLSMPSFDRFEGDYKDLQRSIVIEKEIGDDIIYLIHGNVLPTKKLVKQIKRLKPGEFISVPGLESLVYCISAKQIMDEHRIRVGKGLEVDEKMEEISYPWDIFQKNATAIEQDFVLLSRTLEKGKLSRTNRVINPSQIFMEKGASVEHCVLNATEGPIFIGKNALVMEGSLLRGPVSIGNHAVVKMGSRIYGATTIGPGCVVGGEVKNSIFFEYSNKAHDGYIGDSVIGAWCNLGAGTTNSNIKNNASDVVVYTPNGPVTVGRKCGVFIADYAHTAINTSLNTGTVVGVCANVFGQGLTPKYIPGFAWGSEGVERYRFDKALQDVENWKSLKGQSVTDDEKTVLKHVYDHY